VPFKIVHIGDERSAKLMRDAAAASSDPMEIVASDVGAADVLVFGPAVDNPLATATEMLKGRPVAEVVFLVPRDRLEIFRGSLPFVPHMASAWTVEATASPLALADLLGSAARAATQRASMTSVRDHINRQLTLGGGRAKAETAEALRLRQLALSEDYLATLLGQAPDAFVAVSLSGGIIAWNEAAARMFGASASVAIGSDVAVVFPAQMHDELQELIARGLRGEATNGREVAFSSSAGQRWAELSLAPVRDDGGHVATLSITLRDITERHGNERQLRGRGARSRALTETCPQCLVP